MVIFSSESSVGVRSTDRLSRTSTVAIDIRRKQIEASTLMAFLYPIEPYNLFNIMVNHADPTNPPIVPMEQAVPRFSKPMTQ